MPIKTKADLQGLLKTAGDQAAFVMRPPVRAQTIRRERYRNQVPRQARQILSRLHNAMSLHSRREDSPLNQSICPQVSFPVGARKKEFLTASVKEVRSPYSP